MRLFISQLFCPRSNDKESKPINSYNPEISTLIVFVVPTLCENEVMGINLLAPNHSQAEGSGNNVLTGETNDTWKDCSK
jgi:hypothetical protein